MTLPVDDPAVVIHDVHSALPDSCLGELGTMQMILCGHPAHVRVCRVLPGEYSDTVEVLVDQLQTLGVVDLVTDRLHA